MAAGLITHVHKFYLVYFITWMQIEQLADAAEMNDIEEVKWLIKSGISVNSTNKVRHV